MQRTTSAAVSLVILCVFMGGCQSMYYGAMEKFGVHKRDILVDRVKSARDSQETAKKQFANALEQFKSVVAVKGGELESQYNKLNSALRKSEAEAIASLSGELQTVQVNVSHLIREMETSIAEADRFIRDMGIK